MKNPTPSCYFSTYHPLVNFIYFAAVLLFAMIFMHPACLFISLSLSLGYACLLKGGRALLRSLLFMLPLLLLTALLNPLFNHQGVTIIGYLPSGNPLTLEAALYGLAAAAVFACVLCWFICFNAVVTGEKLICLFGRAAPALSLIFSMTLRLAPRFGQRLQAVAAAQRCLGHDLKQGGLKNRARHGVNIFSIMITWSLEDAIQTSDSMRSRGYGLPGRSSFSVFKFEMRDKRALAALLLLIVCLIAGAAAGGLSWRYFPSVRGTANGFLFFGLLAAYLALCAMPLFINLWEERKWQRSLSRG